ncbi:hypothetical protein [Glaciihabitans sp. UYNi722]|uniref:hypothetical protein n=1 Tax=Glaciihabitans sp. UYNi722 TaxID=3156344 RepID=UPI00339452D5
MRQAEVRASTAAILRGTPYPADQLRDAWRTVLLLQFHDIPPGTSIAWIHQDAEAGYARVAASLGDVIDASLEALAGECCSCCATPRGSGKDGTSTRKTSARGASCSTLFPC